MATVEAAVPRAVLRPADGRVEPPRRCPVRGRVREPWWLDCDLPHGHAGDHWDGVDREWWALTEEGR